MQSKITLIGMYNFDNTLFDKLSFPDGIDRELAINRILNKSEEFELIYSDFDYLQDRIGIWGEIWSRTFSKWVEALNVEYDPLFNYDRHEVYTDTTNRVYEDKHDKAFDDSHNNIKSDNSNKNFEDSHTTNRADASSEESKSTSNTITSSDTDSDTTKKVSAYDEASYSDKELETSNATSNQTGSGNAEGNVSVNSVSNESSGNSGKESLNNNSVESGNTSGTETNNTAGNSNEVTQHSAHLYGNIGVTTSQQMLRDQLDIVTWNLYEHISDIFIDEFCILVY